MLKSANSEVLSPREFKRQVRRYLSLSALLWLAFSVAGFLFLFRQEVTPDISISLFSSLDVFLHATFVMSGLSLLSVAWGLVLTLPTIGLLAISNADSPFNARFESSSRRMRRSLLAFLQPVVFAFTHLLFIWVSLAGAPHELRPVAERGPFLAEWVRVFHEIFYSERSEDHASYWRKAFAGDDPRALVVLLPASVLADAEYFPLVERELGSSVPFFVDASTLEGQLRQLLVGGTAPGKEVTEPFLPPVEVWDGIPHLNEVHVTLGPEWRKVEEAAFARATHRSGPIGHRLSRDTFLGVRLMQSQPHLFLLSRWGVPGWFISGTRWDEISAEDGAMLRRFLNDAVRSRRESRVRVVQFSELDGAASPFPRFAFRSPAALSSEERRQLVRDLDLILGRGLAALRGHPRLTVAVVPYPDFGSGTPLSRAFIKSPGKDVPAGWLLASDLAQPLQSLLAAGKASASESRSGAPPAACRGVRLAPGAAVEGGMELRRALWQGLLSYLKPNASDVFFMPRDFAAFSGDFHEFGVFCRPEGPFPGSQPPSHLVLWADQRPLLGRWGDTLGGAVLKARELFPATGAAVKAAPARAVRASKVAAAPLSPEKGLSLEGSLRVFSVPLRQPSPWLHELNASEASAFLARHGAEVKHRLEAVVHAAQE